MKLAVAAAALALLVVSSASPAPQARLTVFAAASLTDVLPKIDRSPRYSFAGSNQLAAQIQQGAPADVFAAANMTLPRQLASKHLCSKPVVFARNKLVVIVPPTNPARLRRVADLARNGVKVLVAQPGVPVGTYTAQVLRALHLYERVMANVVSKETDVRGVVAKIVLGEADAGFVYATDAKAVRDDLKVIAIPASAEPGINYGICVVAAGGHAGDARVFVKKVLSRAGQRKLRSYGFVPRR